MGSRPTCFAHRASPESVSAVGRAFCCAVPKLNSSKLLNSCLLLFLLTRSLALTLTLDLFFFPCPVPRSSPPPSTPAAMHRGTKHRGRSGSFSFSSAERDDDDDYNNIQPPALKSSHTAAATPAAADAAAPVDTTLMVSDDIINMVATFASCRDLCNLGQVCRRFSPLPFHEDLWELRALDILYGAPQLRSAMSALSLATCRELVETFTRIGIPGGVLGFWQAEPPSLTSAAAGMELLSARLLSGAPPHRRQQQQQEGGVGGGAGPSTEELETRGELLRIGLEAGGFVCETIAPDGVRRR